MRKVLEEREKRIWTAKPPHELMFLATEIEWDTDGEDVDLPSEAMVEVECECESVDECECEDMVADILSDTYDWLIAGMEVKRVKPTPE